MAIVVTQVNIFRCQKCAKVKSVSRECEPWEAPTIKPPEGWDLHPKQFDPNARFMCPACLTKARKKKSTMNC